MLFRKNKVITEDQTTEDIPNAQTVEDLYIEALVPLTREILSFGRRKMNCPTLKSTQVAGKPNGDGYGGMDFDKINPVKKGEPFNLISSAMANGSSNHLPVIDIDVPIMTVESSTPGHYHLYINKQVPWQAYERMVLAMVNAGVVERGWYDAMVARKQGCLRPPHVKKAHYYDLLLEGLNEMAKEA